MSSKISSSSSSGGIGFLGALALLFIALKLLGYIDWSWWWVTAPLWGGFALVIAIPLSVLGIVFVVESRKDKRIAEERRRRLGL